MNFSAIWVRRPVMTILVMISLLLFGILSYFKLPVNDLPNVDYPTIQVSAKLPGASPETMASSVALPLEKQFSTIDGIESMSSTNTMGSTTINITFSLNRNIDAAAQDVNSAISATLRRLPKNMPAPPSYSKTNPAEQPIMYYVVTSKTMLMSDVQSYVETSLLPAVATVEGVSQAQIFGSQRYAVRLYMDPGKMAVRNVGLNEITSALSDGNVNMPGGTLQGPDLAYTVDSTGQIYNADGYNKLIVAYNNGSPIRVGDIGQAVDATETQYSKRSLITPENGKSDAVFVAISKQPGANAVQIAKDVKRKIAQVQQTLPQSIDVFPLYDKSEFIEESVLDVQLTLVLTVFLVIAVVYLFIGEVRATIIPGLAVPISLIGTFSIMSICGYSLNNITLMALTLAAGFVVDDAIVVMENIVRRVEEGESPWEATFSGSAEIGFTIISMTISLVVVFVPILFMSGVVGRLFREFAVSIATAILFSGFISLTLTPMMCAYLLKQVKPGEHQEEKSNFMKKVDAAFESVKGAYARTLNISLDHPKKAMAFTLGVFVLSGLLFTKIDKGFIPNQDLNMFVIRTQGEDRSSFNNFAEQQEAVNKIIAQEQGIRGALSGVGMPQYNTGSFFISLKERGERSESVDQIINRLRPQLSSIPGLRVYPYNPPPITIGSRQSYGVGQFTITSPDLDLLAKAAQDMEAEMRRMPGLTDINSSLQLRAPKVILDIDRDKASSLGISASQIQDTLYSSFADRQVTTIYTASNQFDVYLDLGRNFQQDPTALNSVYIKAKTGALVPLSTITKQKEVLSSLSVNHSGQMPAATISFNLQPGYALGTVSEQITAVSKSILPAGVGGFFEGNASAMQSSFSNMGFLLFITVFIIYVVLGILYESFVHPITILTSLPLAGAGALIFLMLFGMELDVYSYVGIIMLVGIVKKNGIMMIDFALEKEEQDKCSARESIYEACLIRFRPIMMTTMAAIFGALPIALGIGAGGEARQPLGVAVVGGLVFSQMLTLYITPVFYIWIDGWQKKLSAKKEQP